MTTPTPADILAALRWLVEEIQDNHDTLDGDPPGPNEWMSLSVEFGERFGAVDGLLYRMRHGMALPEDADATTPATLAAATRRIAELESELANRDKCVAILETQSEQALNTLKEAVDELSRLRAQRDKLRAALEQVAARAPGVLTSIVGKALAETEEA